MSELRHRLSSSEVWGEMEEQTVLRLWDRSGLSMCGCGRAGVLISSYRPHSCISSLARTALKLFTMLVLTDIKRNHLTINQMFLNWCLYLKCVGIFISYSTNVNHHNVLLIRYKLIHQSGYFSKCCTIMWQKANCPNLPLIYLLVHKNGNYNRH